MSSDPIHSTGRGGAGNIGKDTNTYVDGDIVREGTPGVGTGEYSAGRGGAGNIVHPTTNKASEEIVPESATRVPGESYDNFHTGRGGQGNVHMEKYGGHSSVKDQKAAEHQPGQHGVGLVDKVKHMVGLDKEKTPEPEAK